MFSCLLKKEISRLDGIFHGIVASGDSESAEAEDKQQAQRNRCGRFRHWALMFTVVPWLLPRFSRLNVPTAGPVWAGPNKLVEKDVKTSC